MTYLTRAICRRAGWDYEQVIVEQVLSAQKRPRYLVGYGAYISVEPETAGSFTDILHDLVDRWNSTETAAHHLTVTSFDGWAMGTSLGEFVYFSCPGEILLPVAIPATTGVTMMLGYVAPAEQVDALARFMSTLSASSSGANPSVHTGALQITYFQP